jgi:endonuclease YncB( thermonuclease family)
MRGTVTKIYDGDTFQIAIKEESGELFLFKCRIKNINAPEIGTAIGKVAKVHLEAILPLGTVVEVHNERDKYGRFLIVCVPNYPALDEYLVGLGLAFHYPQASVNTNLFHIEEDARKREVGLWEEEFFSQLFKT